MAVLLRRRYRRSAMTYAASAPQICMSAKVGNFQSGSINSSNSFSNIDDFQQRRHSVNDELLESRCARWSCLRTHSRTRLARCEAASFLTDSIPCCDLSTTSSELASRSHILSVASGISCGIATSGLSSSIGYCLYRSSHSSFTLSSLRSRSSHSMLFWQSSMAGVLGSTQLCLCWARVSLLFRVCLKGSSWMSVAWMSLT